MELSTDKEQSAVAVLHPPRLPVAHRSACATGVELYRFLQQWDASNPLCRHDPTCIRQRTYAYRRTLRELMQWSDLSRDACRRHRTAYERDIKIFLESVRKV